MTDPQIPVQEPSKKPPKRRGGGGSRDGGRGGGGSVSGFPKRKRQRGKDSSLGGLVGVPEGARRFVRRLGRRARLGARQREEIARKPLMKLAKIIAVTLATLMFAAQAAEYGGEIYDPDAASGTRLMTVKGVDGKQHEFSFTVFGVNESASG